MSETEANEPAVAAAYDDAATIAGTKVLIVDNDLAHAEAVAEMLARPDDDPTDLAALDAVWEETEVTFGPDPNAGCPQVRDLLAEMDKPDTLRPAAE